MPNMTGWSTMYWPDGETERVVTLELTPSGVVNVEVTEGPPLSDDMPASVAYDPRADSWAGYASRHVEAVCK